MLHSKTFARSIFSFAVFMLLSASVCHAQATRTWVSGVGDDVNPCSRTAPCKTFAGAISKTAPGGIIDALDPAGYGPVTITKAITIETPPGYGGILSAATNGVIVNAGASDIVVLRGLAIDGVGTGVNGVRFLAGSKLVMENCYVAGATNGVDFEPSGVSKLQMINTTVNKASGNAVLIQAGAAGTATASLENVRLTNSGFGLKVVKGIVSMKDSMVSGSATTGVKAAAVSSAAQISVDDSLISDNAGGVNSAGALSSIFLSRSTVSNNTVGVSASLSGVLTSFGNNRISGNTTDGNPTATVNER
jgi:hypothetical protein